MFGARFTLVVVGLCMLSPISFAQEYLGNWSSNPYAPNSTANRYGAGNRYNHNSVTNPAIRGSATYNLAETAQILPPP